MFRILTIAACFMLTEASEHYRKRRDGPGDGDYANYRGNQEQSYDGVPQYSYVYEVKDLHTQDIKSHKEERHGDLTKGVYYFVEPDGSMRTVEYSVQGDSGFNVKVHREHMKHPVPSNKDGYSVSVGSAGDGVDSIGNYGPDRGNIFASQVGGSRGQQVNGLPGQQQAVGRNNQGNYYLDGAGYGTQPPSTQYKHMNGRYNNDLPSNENSIDSGNQNYGNQGSTRHGHPSTSYASFTTFRDDQTTGYSNGRDDTRRGQLSVPFPGSSSSSKHSPEEGIYQQRPTNDYGTPTFKQHPQASLPVGNLSPNNYPSNNNNLRRNSFEDTPDGNHATSSLNFLSKDAKFSTSTRHIIPNRRYGP